MARYASQKPAGYKNFVHNVAIVGAGGQVGTHITNALLSQGKHHVTAITRPESTNKLPNVHTIKKVDQSNHAEFVDALKGQDVLILTLPAGNQRDAQTTIVDAAVEAGVKYIMPNEWGVDCSNESLANDVLIGAAAKRVRDYIKEKGQGKTHFIACTCSFWYEYSLAGTEARYGFDFGEKKVVFFDDGNTKITTSTWPQTGRAVAKLFALPILPKDENDKSLTLSQFHDDALIIKSFTVSQRDMFDSVLRVTGDKESDWKIIHEDAKERFERSVDIMEKGNIVGFAMRLYTRVFYKNGGGDLSDKVVNKELGLPEEDLDEYTKKAIEMAKEDNIWPRMSDRVGNHAFTQSRLNA
ncbi:Bifunctional pinoresinol-lariciresinol reductase 1 [Pseudocercospora fuligena]|uniref:Bifunctional pinoresinol-lariciresinol reductase 1 n=1 Tax=Pseudocercospora fuligena TaxID=685502 RepID=A0A8H6R8M4_9PEZI|nr:Bifunctional pinoresinol-lariciresinol reductase 1 [Pseudocercospora fuligena]